MRLIRKRGSVGSLALSGGLLVAALSGCGGPGEPVVEFRELAYIDLGGPDSVQVSVPDTVIEGVAFKVMVQTYPLSTYGRCERPAETNVSVEGLRAEIVPYTLVRIPPPSENPVRCSPGEWRRTIVLGFSEAGSAQLVVRGLRQTPSPSFDTAEVEVSFDITVRAACPLPPGQACQ